MPVIEVAGCERLIEALDEAVGAGGSLPQLTRRVADALSGLIDHGRIDLPPEMRRPLPDRYARRLVHRDAERGYTAVLMVWGPGQATPLHDHWGMWCVEVVVEGRIQVAQYRLVERADERFRFEPAGEVEAGQGSSGRLIPPFEYHTIANAVPGGVTVTLHVYGGEMERCHAFEPIDHAADARDAKGASKWYQRVERQLTYTA